MQKQHTGRFKRRQQLHRQGYTGERGYIGTLLGPPNELSQREQALLQIARQQIPSIAGAKSQKTVSPAGAERGSAETERGTASQWPEGWGAHFKSTCSSQKLQNVATSGFVCPPHSFSNLSNTGSNAVSFSCPKNNRGRHKKQQGKTFAGRQTLACVIPSAATACRLHSKISCGP